MRRFAVVLGISALLGLAPLVAHADISIAGNSEVMDISLRDAEIGEVLIALFNTTNGKYQLQIGNGVVGRIARLQLTQTPFERALDAVLGTEYSFNKTQLQDGAYLYKISGRQTATPTVPAAGTRTTGTLAPPSGSVGTATTGTATGGNLGGATDFSTTLSWKTATSPGGATGGAIGGGAATGAPASSENSYVKLIRLSNLSVESFCDALGVESMPWISSLGQQNNNNGTNNNSNNNNNNGYNDNNNNGYNNNNNNNNGYNNNNNNNNGYNNNNNNNNGNNNNNTRNNRNNRNTEG